MDLLKKGKVGKLPTRSSTCIREETISKMVKKGDERKERKKATAFNAEFGLINEAIPKDDPEHEPSFDNEQDLNFQPASQKSKSADDEVDYVAEARTKAKQVRRSLDVEDSAVSKSPSLKKSKQPKPLPVAASTNPINTGLSSSTAKGKSVAQGISSSDSSSSKKMKCRRHKSTAPLPLKKKLASRSPPQTRQKKSCIH